MKWTLDLPGWIFSRQVYRQRANTVERQDRWRQGAILLPPIFLWRSLARKGVERDVRSGDAVSLAVPNSDRPLDRNRTAAGASSTRVRVALRRAWSKARHVALERDKDSLHGLFKQLLKLSRGIPMKGVDAETPLWIEQRAWPRIETAGQGVEQSSAQRSNFHGPRSIEQSFRDLR